MIINCASKFRLIYFNDPLETPDIILERDFFQKNPSFGNFGTLVHRPNA